MKYTLALAVMVLASILFGIVIGLTAGTIRAARKERRRDAPVPIDLGYDPMNPINGRQSGHGEPIVVDGVTLWRV